MSETVHYKGVLKKVERFDGENLEQQCKRLLGNKELPSYFDSYEEFLLDNYYKTMTVQNDTVYEVKAIEVDADSDIFNATLLNDGQIEFEVRYYNGGCGFDEAIEEAIKNIGK
ncbi:hypothetical protein [Solibacillus isronensis]|uniref:hypothetical protein n=1 Tax=Solibacillus isronensis TaxID=412383 RepID=UPI0039A1A334